MNPLAVIRDEVGREVEMLRKSDGWKGRVVGCLCVAGTAVVFPTAMIILIALVGPPWLVIRLAMGIRARIELWLLYRESRRRSRMVTTSGS